MSAYSVTLPELGTVPCGVLESSRAGKVRHISELDDINELVRMHRARILRFATYSTGDPDLAETVAQDTLLRAYTNREQFRAESSLKTWLTGIAINVIRDHLRTKRYKFWKQVKSSSIDIYEMSSYIAVEGLNPEGRLLAKEKIRRLTAALENLSHNQRMIFLMRFSDEMPVSEISEVLKMPVNTVRTHLQRALKSVRGQLGETI